VRVHGHENDLKAGEYEFKAHASMKDIMDILVSGKAILHPVTVVEGTTVAQALNRIAENEFLSATCRRNCPRKACWSPTRRNSRAAPRARS
jgi:UPF0755 protein